MKIITVFKNRLGKYVGDFRNANVKVPNKPGKISLLSVPYTLCLCMFSSPLPDGILSQADVWLDPVWKRLYFQPSIVWKQSEHFGYQQKRSIYFLKL